MPADSQLTVVIARDRETSGGGIFNYYQAIGKHLASKAHFVGVGRPYDFYGKKSSRLFRSTLLRLLCDWLALFFKILRTRPDIVHINPSMDPPTFRSLRRDAMNVLIARLLGRPVLVFWRGWENACCGQPEFPGGNKSLLCRIYKLGAAHVVLSERFRQDLLRWGFETPIYVETTVVADECLKGAPAPKTGQVRTNLLYLSRVEVAKGVFELLDAYKILKARNPAYTLTVGGDGPDLEDLRKYARDQGLADVTFSGFLKGEAKVKCYNEGNIFCFLSYTEGMPNAVLEALAMGFPILSSDAGGLRDILKNGENGFILPPNMEAPWKKKFEPLVVANAIERLAASPELYERIATVNWRYARQRFAAPVVAKRIDGIYQNVLTTEPAGGKAAKPICAE